MAAARLACVTMALPQIVVIVLLFGWQQPTHAWAVSAVLVAQLAAMVKMLSDPKKLAPWYNATGVSLYVTGMMISAFAVRGVIGT
jgi:chlorophyll synthase